MPWSSSRIAGYSMSSCIAGGLTLIWLLLAVAVQADSEPIVVYDDAGRKVSLAKPARRIISLAPHITENLFSAGAGNALVGVVAYSDYPKAAQQITSVGSYKRFNLEAMAALQPDLVIAWRSGNGMGKIQQIMDLGLQVYITDPRRLEDIATSVEHYGLLSGNEQTGREASRRFNETLQQLRRVYSAQAPVSVFYQVWNKPLHTITGKHLISDVIRLCGGRNVFENVLALAPKVSVESVLVANPQVIIASGMGEARPEWLDDWLQWPSLQAVQNEHLYFIPPELVQRHTMRILQGAQKMCEQLQRVRQKPLVVNH